MKNMKSIKDKRLEFIEALIHCADLSGDINPHVYKDEMLKKLDVCEHVFNIMQKQLGDRYCHMVDGFEERIRYAVDVNKCLQLRDQIIQENEKDRRYRDSIRKTLLATSLGTFLVILVSCVV